jgi:hypothetical protein
VACVGGLLVLDRRGVRYFGRARGLLSTDLLSTDLLSTETKARSPSGNAWGPRLEQFLYHGIAALIRNSRSVR